MGFDDLQEVISCSRFTGLERNLSSKRFSDFQIVCGEHTFYVHRLVLAHRYDYFWTLTSSDFSEAHQQVAQFPDDDPSLIARLVYFMYTGKLLTRPLVDTRIEQFEDVDDPYMCEDQNLMLAANMYSMAVKYGATDLARLAASLFRTSIGKELHLLPDWTELVAFVYEPTPPDARDLRNVVISRLQKNPQKSVRSSLPDRDELIEAIRTVPSLAEDLAIIHFTDDLYICTICRCTQSVLDLPCNHGKRHTSGDPDCFVLSLEKQECSSCHELGTLSEVARSFYVSPPSSTYPATESSAATEISAINW